MMPRAWVFAAAVVVALALAASTGVHAVSSCDADVSAQSVPAGATVTVSCPTSTRGALGFRVTSNARFAVYFADSTNCANPTFNYYEEVSYPNQNAGTTVGTVVSGDYSPTWRFPCVRIRNLETNAPASMTYKVEYFPATFPNQFHLANTGQYFSGVTGNDVAVSSVWPTRTGAGVVIDICDDGLQKDHEEIAPRFRGDLSIDYATGSSDPSGDVAGGDTHGTGCGGVAAADGANSVCGKGAAYGAQLAGHRILFSGASDANYADAMWNANVPVDVSSNSWGPTGCTAGGCEYYTITPAIQSAIQAGAVSGRQGRGKVYTFAAGNEGHFGGDCNQYPFTKLSEVITVVGSSYIGQRIWYSSAGSCAFVNSPTQGTATLNQMLPGIITAQGGLSNSGCRDDFGGTSSATPLVAGVVALIMEAQPRATARDVQYALQASATKNDPTHPSWITNAAGANFNRYYGFGRANALGAVNYVTAAGWKPVGPLYTSASPQQTVNAQFTAGSTGITRTYTFAGNDVRYIENVIVFLNAAWSPVQQIRVTLTSPAGTVVDLALPTAGRSPQQTSFPQNYPLSARAFWGEDPTGTWSLKLSAPNAGSGSGTFSSFQLNVYGAAACTPACAGANTVCARNNQCMCASGFVDNGAGVCVASATCASSPCQNGGTCIEGSGSYQCRCPGNGATYGANCQLLPSPCASDPCQYGGVCTVRTNGGFSCACTNPYDTTATCQLSAAATASSSFLAAAAAFAATLGAVALV